MVYKIQYLVFMLILHVELLPKCINLSAFYVLHVPLTRWNNVIRTSGSRKSNSSFQDLLPLRNFSGLLITYKNYLRLRVAIFWNVKLCSLLHVTDVSKEFASSIISTDGCSRTLWNVSILLSDYKVPNYRSLPFSQSLSWKSQI